jgi:condensin complex subunit 2
MPRARVFSGTAATPAKTPVKIPLNDDRQEKANRLHSRQAQHELHMSQIKAAATPVRKRRSLLGQSPRTPGDGEENDLPSIAGTAVTPMKRVPILANFEEWMKMATDNVCFPYIFPCIFHLHFRLQFGLPFHSYFLFS